MQAAIPTRIAPSAQPSPLSPRGVEREFLRRIEDGAEIRPAGSAGRNPRRLLSLGYLPRHKVDLFDTTYYLTCVRENDDIRFFVAYVAGNRAAASRSALHPRIFYKDLSLVWRSASHYVRSRSENWIGKGDVRVSVVGGDEVVSSAEATTDLPLEVQTALETLSRSVRRACWDEAAVGLVLRRGPEHRIEAYRDFTGPRRRAQADPRNLVNRGRSIARFTRRNDPTSLRFARGFEPDFGRGVLEVSSSTSRLYGGKLRRFRILSSNRRVQYLFMAAPRHVWIVPPQATTTEISSYGVRTVDVVADEELFVPGYEYHGGESAEEECGPDGQIPEGFAGEVSEHDASRADASAWLDRLPVIREFRRRILGASRSASAARRPRRA